MGRQAMFPLTAWQSCIATCLQCLLIRGPGVSPRELSLVLGAVAGLADVVGARSWPGAATGTGRFLQYFLALGAGFMLAVAFLRMVPESLEKGSHLYLYVLIGYFVVHLTEHTLTPHFHFGEEVHHDALVHPAWDTWAWPGSASTRSSTAWRSRRASW